MPATFLIDQLCPSDRPLCTYAYSLCTYAYFYTHTYAYLDLYLCTYASIHIRLN